MRKVIVFALVIAACGPRENAATDTAAMASGSAVLTAADIAGTWNGVTLAATGDSVLARWTVVSPTGMESKGVFEGASDSVSYTHTFDADSFVATTAPYIDQTLPGQPEVVARAVGRLIAGKLVAMATITLASNPDSVLSRSRWEATKSP